MFVRGHFIPFLQKHLLYLHSRNLTPFVILSLFVLFCSETTAKEFTPATISNGMKALIIERPHTDTVTINIYIGIGRINEPRSGAANLLMHMLFRGSKKYTAPEITKEIARMGGRLDYYVGYLSTFVSMSLPTNLPFPPLEKRNNSPSPPPLKKGGEGGFNKAIALLTDIIFNPVLDTDELEKERTLILQRMAISNDFPSNRFVREIMLRQFPDHPFGRASEGTEDSVRQIDAELLKSYHRRFYVPDNISVVIVGNVIKEDVEKMLVASLMSGTLSKAFPLSPPLEGGGRGGVRPRTSSSVTSIVNKRIVLNEHVTQAQIFVGRPIPGLDQKERHILLVMDKVLSGLNGRLFNTLRKKHGCVYSVGIWEAIYPEIGLWGVYAGTETRELKDTERLIVSELKKLINQLVELEELATAQKLLETLIRTKYETNSSFAREAGSSLVKGEVILPMEERIKLVQSVTAEDIKSLAEKLFDRGEFNVIIMK